MTKLSGEEYAIKGYNKQYEVCAIEIYEELLNNNLEWVEFASANAGKLDDVLIGCKKYIKAFQVKDIDESITYTKLITPSKKHGKSILEGCFEGWKNLKNQYNKEIIGKYISNEKPSSHDKISLFKDSKKPSFSDFIIKFWEYLKKNPIESLDNAWMPIFDNLVEICKAENKEFIDFIKSLNFVLNNVYNVQEQIYDYNGYQRRKDIDKISKNIFKIIGTKGRVKFDRKKLLTEFDLLQRYETYFQHSFFVDEEHYQPINETIQDLENTINKNKNGYIAIIGNAGSGKSTLLTKWINEKNDRVLKYYAYINKEMDYDFGYRGEASLFLKDLLIQIRENEFSSQKELPADSIEELQKQLSNELKRLEFDDRKTYIIVDGLDHIEREQKVNKSLIEILPSPENIPNNVYFILGSRTIQNLENLPEKIKHYLKKKDSIVTIKTLTIEQIKKISESYNILLDENQLNELKENTLGHPLFLRYTIEELIKISEDNYTHFISLKNFSGNIHDEYEIFWNKNKLQTNFIDILGIISRFRYTYIDINLLYNFKTDRITLHKIKSLSEHYFYKNGNIWQFFHNSFKEFLKEKTAEDFFSEEYKESIHLNYHKRIYDVIKDINSDYKWNILYHLYHAKEYEKLSKIANQSFFRTQWFEFRNYKNILEDIKLSAKSSYFTNNTITLVDSFFSLFEISQRANNFNICEYYNAFLQLGKIDIANSFIFNNFELLAPKTKVLDYAIALYKIGNIELSQTLLKKAKPHYILNISKEASPYRYNTNENSEIDEVELIVKWAVLSCLFNPITEVIDCIKVVKIIENEYVEGGKRDILVETVEQLQELLYELNNSKKLIELYEILIKIEGFDLFYFYFNTVFELENDNELFKLSLNKLSKWENTNSNPKNRRLALIEALINKNIEKSSMYFAKLKTLAEINEDKSHHVDDIREHLSYIYDYSRLFYITSKDFSIETTSFIPKTKKTIVSAFYNEFAELGKCYAYFYYNYQEASKGFIFRISQILRYFHNHVRDSQYEYSIYKNKIYLLKIILRNSSRISKDFFKELLKIISTEWYKNNRFWKIDEKQEVIEFVLNLGLNNDWCLNEINILNKDIFESGDSYSKIERGIKQIELFCRLNKIQSGNEILKKIMESSLCIKYEDDHQLNYLLEWYTNNEKLELSSIEYIIKSLKSIRFSTNHANEHPAEKMLKILNNYGNGYEFFKYFLFEGHINFCSSLEISLNYFLKKLPNYKFLITKIFTRILLNFDNSYSPRLDFIKEIFDENTEENFVKFLVKEIKIYAVFEHRNYYLFEIQNHCITKDINLDNIGLNETIIIKNNHSSIDENSNLSLKDGTSITLNDVLQRIKNFDDIINLIENEVSNSYFQWSQVISKLLSSLTLKQIDCLLQKKSFDSVELTNIAKAVFDFYGDIEFSRKLIYKALDKSKISGWIPHYDGGSKLKPFKLLKEIDKSSGHIAFKSFTEDIEVASYGDGILDKLDDVLKIIDNDFSYKKYFPNVKEYTTKLLKLNYNDIIIPNLQGNLEDKNFLTDVIIFLMGFPSHFDQILIEILTEELENCQNIVEDVLILLKERKLDFQFISLLSMISLINEEFTKKFKGDILSFFNHSRLDIHIIASRILDRLKIDYEYIYIPFKGSIPFTYTMDFEYKPELVLSSEERMKRLDKTGYLRDTCDPLEYCHLYKNEIKYISRDSGINMVNITLRIMQLGENDFVQPNWYKGLSEKEIRDIYDHKFDLKVSYRRPQYQKVWKGMMMVLKELLDLGKISYEVAYFIANNFDESTFKIQIDQKPNFISSILKNDNYAPSPEIGWVYNIDEKYLNSNLKFKAFENLFIIAEYTSIKGQGGGDTSEIRQSFVDIQEFKENINNEFIFNSSTKKQISDYPFIEIQSLCFYNCTLVDSNKKKNWLAFNPVLAEKMGLKLSEVGNFRWIDKNDNVVIESVFWKNNDEYNRSRNLHSETGYGWYIIITQEGLDKLKEIGINNLYQHKKISRSMRYYQRKYNYDINENNDAVKISNIDL